MVRSVEAKQGVSGVLGVRINRFLAGERSSSLTFKAFFEAASSFAIVFDTFVNPRSAERGLFHRLDFFFPICFVKKKMIRQIAS